jgi:hypothetical protein
MLFICLFRTFSFFNQEKIRLEAAEKGLIGTPLKEKELEMPSSVPVWNQTVTDEKGRRRFHGAFTGGFSAGYFNTVSLLRSHSFLLSLLSLFQKKKKKLSGWLC